MITVTLEKEEKKSIYAEFPSIFFTTLLALTLQPTALKA